MKPIQAYIVAKLGNGPHTERKLIGDVCGWGAPEDKAKAVVGPALAALVASGRIEHLPDIGVYRLPAKLFQAQKGERG